MRESSANAMNAEPWVTASEVAHHPGAALAHHFSLEALPE